MQGLVSKVRLACLFLSIRLYVPAVSQAVGPNYLVWYSILCALTASVGTWVVHLISYLWHNLFEDYVVQERSTQQKVLLYLPLPVLCCCIQLQFDRVTCAPGYTCAHGCLKGVCWN